MELSRFQSLKLSLFGKVIVKKDPKEGSIMWRIRCKKCDTVYTNFTGKGWDSGLVCPTCNPDILEDFYGIKNKVGSR